MQAQQCVINHLAELIHGAKAGKLTTAFKGNGISIRRAGELAQRMSGTFTRHGPYRCNAMPELPTVEDATGVLFKGDEASAWCGLPIPSNLPQARIADLQRGTANALASPALKKRLAADSVVAGEATQWARVD